ncbi:S-adenosyl-L-methionine-dependent methyltransferase [Polyplosphaeria fusca]|uniref:S-adenosyl-L-methionine-dependent methyltransferase n=1 Tax=Polyplosphaeria fusca TaxID=682080 RepID=A0A9P4QQB8_9PLEO|nr:S-adenosyl-L-methionine-dependent methyltransferase [Polyplosphaeria fusca]
MWPNSGEPSETGFSLANGGGTTLYEVFMKQPHRAAEFAVAMHAFTSSPDMSLDHLTGNPLWKTCNTVVDVGGSTGTTAVALARAHPHLHVTVQDLPPNVEGASNGLLDE